MTPDLWLSQKGSEIRLSPDQEGYERIVEAGHVVGHHLSNPIVTLPHMPKTSDHFDDLDVPEEPFVHDHPTCSCGATDDWHLVSQYKARDGTGHIVKCRACERVAVAYDADDGPVEYAGHAEP